jgi:alpha-L-fucosidase
MDLKMEICKQRLSIEKLQEWEKLGYGMFIHFGMSTFDETELSLGDKPSTFYAPQNLDVDQWISVAKNAGMKYAVLTTKHVSGHCLWPTKYNDYHVGTSGNTTDVVNEFVTACRKHGIMPGLYYCSWDNHNLFGSKTPTMTEWELAYTTTEYQDFQTNQLTELLTQYGEIGEVWIDIPKVLTRDYRNKLYNHVASLQPNAVIMFNNGIGDGTNLSVKDTWPTDLIAIERFAPNSETGHQCLREIEGEKYYIPAEVCDPICKQWFYVEGDKPRLDAELLGMYLISRSRNANLLLDIGPDKSGVIPQNVVDSLYRLKENIDKFEKA